MIVNWGVHDLYSSRDRSKKKYYITHIKPHINKNKKCGNNWIGDLKKDKRIEDNKKVDDRVCTYSNASVKVTGIDITALLLKFGLPPLKTIDNTICDYQKEEILDKLLEILRKLGVFVNSADYVAAAISFGRGRFDFSVIDLLSGIPTIGLVLGKAMSSFLNKSKVGRWIVHTADEKLDQEKKDKIIDVVQQALALPAPPPADILMSLINGAILFGRKRWDEAVFSLLTLGLGTVFKDVIEKFVAVLQKPLAVVAYKSGLIDNVGRLTASGQSAAKIAGVGGVASGVGYISL